MNAIAIVRLPRMDRALRDAEVARYVRRQPYFRPGTIDAEYLSLHSVNVPNVSGETEAHARSQVRNNQGICFASIEIVISTKLHEEKLPSGVAQKTPVCCSVVAL